MLKILTGAPGYVASLSEQDLKEFLTTKILNLHLGTVDEAGHANVHPVGYVIMITSEMRVVVDPIIYREYHDRWLLSSNINYNLMSGDVVKEDNMQRLKGLENRPPFLEVVAKFT